MALYLNKEGQLVESDLSLDELGSGYREPTTRDLEAHNSEVDYDAKGLGGQAAETIGTGVKSAIRGAEAGLDALGVDTGVQRDEHGNPTALPGAANEGLFGQEAQFEAGRHPIATGLGQGALAAPLGIGAGALGGLAGVGAGLAAESAGGGYAAEAENAWLQDRDFSQEAAITNVGAGLLVGGGLMGAGALGGMATRGIAKRLGRNLLTEAEHGASARAARDLLDDAPKAKGGNGLDAEEIARRGPDDAGVAYLRDNADTLTDDLATKQAKAAQALIDTYGEMAPLRPTRRQVDELIPDAPVEQARWVAQARSDVAGALEGLPADVAKGARERLAKLGDGADPARWFTEASEASDELLRASAKARRSASELAPDAADALSRAKAVLDDGLKDEALWGGAAKFEAQRAAGYAKRYGEHIDDFENAFSPGGKTDPAAFRRVLAGEADPAAVKALDATLDSARATADVAEQFGRKAEAGRIREAIDELERTARQGQAVAAARATVSRGTKSAAQRGLEWLAREGARGVTEEAVETGFKGLGAIAGGAIGGPPGAVAGWLGGRYLSKRFTDVAADRIGAAAARAAGDAVGDKLSASARAALGRVRARAGQEGAVKLTDAEYEAQLAAFRAGRKKPAAPAPEPDDAAYEAQLAAFRAGRKKPAATGGSDMDRFMAAARAAADEHKPGELMLMANVRDRAGLSKEAFDKAAREAGASGDIVMHFHDQAHGFTEARRAPYVFEPEGFPNMQTGKRDPTWFHAMQITPQGMAKAKGGQSGMVALGDGPNFSLGDVAKSPMGVVTGLGAAGLGARELYEAQQDEARQGTFAAVRGLAESSRATLTRAVQKLLSRPADGDTGLVVPAPAPRVTMDNFDATRDHLDKMARDPEYFADVMAASFGSMPEAAPEVYSALSAEAAKTVQYLAAVAPGGSSGGPFGQKIPVGTDDLWEFNERMRAVTDPDFVPEELAAGRLSSQAVEAYELMRPTQYAHLQRTVFERLGELNEAGIPVTVATREQLDVLLNIDGGGDPALTWKVAERAYAAQARKAQSASAIDAGGGGDASSAMQSGALSTLGNGASALAQTR